MQVSRIDKPWVWPLITTVGGVPLALAFGPAGWGWRVLLILIGSVVLSFATWANTRRGASLKRLERELQREQKQRADALAALETRRQETISELEVVRASLDETRATVDKVVERMIKRKCLAANFTDQDRMTWLLVGVDHLRVVGRHCHDPRYNRVDTWRYPIGFGLMGRAVASRKAVSVSLEVTTGRSYEKAQERFGRLDAAEVPQLGMRSMEYRVVPLIDQTGLNVLGVVVLESTEHGTTRLDELAEQLQRSDTNGTIVDVLEVLAQAPDPETEVG